MTDDLAALRAECERLHTEMVPLPWQAKPRNFKNEEHPWHWYITGDIHESQDDGEDEPGLCGIGLAVLPGNPTCGDIVKNQANGIAALRNALPVIIAALARVEAAEREVERLTVVRDTMKSECGHAIERLTERLGNTTAERDAALARVEALEAAMREAKVWMVGDAPADVQQHIDGLLAAPATGGERRE